MVLQALQTLVRNLAVILLLATFLEMLLPNKSMRGYVQLVVGLFVISAILSPITAFLHTPLSLDIPAWTSSSQQTLPAMADGSPEARLGRDTVLEQYRQILVHQIEALAVQVKGVKGALVQVDFEEDEGGLTDQPRIAMVNITLSTAQGEIQPVQPVIIGGNPGPASEPLSSLAQSVQERVSQLMEIPKDKVVVKEARSS